jgi:hypothetical protein
MAKDPRTRIYFERRTAEGKSKREIMRCLKRYVAREVYRDLNPVLGALDRQQELHLYPSRAPRTPVRQPTASDAESDRDYVLAKASVSQSQCGRRCATDRSVPPAITSGYPPAGTLRSGAVPEQAGQPVRTVDMCDVAFHAGDRLSWWALMTRGAGACVGEGSGRALPIATRAT